MNFEDKLDAMTDARKVTEFFQQEEHKEGEVTKSPLGYKELSESLLKEGYELSLKVKSLQAAERDVKEEVRVFLGNERGLVARGAYAVDATERKARETIDYAAALDSIKEWAVGLIGDEAKKDLAKIIAKHTKIGEPTVALSFKKLG